MSEMIQPSTANSPGRWLSRNWLPLFLLVWGVFNLLPWLAPLFMHIGWRGLGEALYLIYMPLCHQMPQRSFFLFGPEWSYSLADIQAAWQSHGQSAGVASICGQPGNGLESRLVRPDGFDVHWHLAVGGALLAAARRG
jgi:hypothetical protein